jgi:hypothetical protein
MSFASGVNSAKSRLDRDSRLWNVKWRTFWKLNIRASSKQEGRDLQVRNDTELHFRAM